MKKFLLPLFIVAALVVPASVSAATFPTPNPNLTTNVTPYGGLCLSQPTYYASYRHSSGALYIQVNSQWHDNLNTPCRVSESHDIAFNNCGVQDYAYQNGETLAVGIFNWFWPSCDGSTAFTLRAGQVLYAGGGYSNFN